MKKCKNKWNLKWINLKINYTSDDEMHEKNEYSNEMDTGMKLNGGITMNTGMKLNVALMEMKAQINV